MIKVFAGFFAFGTAMCILTIMLLLFPGPVLDSLWRLNPEARAAFQSIGPAAIALMFVVGTGCAFAAVGLWRNMRWGVNVAIVVLSANLIGDLFNTVWRQDYRTLIGLPIAGAMIFYLVRHVPAAKASPR
jgi:uncharacterized membrane protein (DUF2068 family)